MSDRSLINADIFDPKNISPETAELNTRIEKMLAASPPMYSLKPQNIREAREAGKGLWPVTRRDELKDRSIPEPEPGENVFDSLPPETVPTDPS